MKIRKGLVIGASISVIIASSASSAPDRRICRPIPPLNGPVVILQPQDRSCPPQYVLVEGDVPGAIDTASPATTPGEGAGRNTASPG
jgi:hypothetical protein